MFYKHPLFYQEVCHVLRTLTGVSLLVSQMLAKLKV